MTHSPALHWLTQRCGDVPRHNAWLAPDERTVLDRLQVLKRRSEWRLGRWTAKCLLAERLRVFDYRDVEVEAAADGAPEAFVGGQRVPGGISISHSNGMGLCVFSMDAAGVGCDVELVESRSDAFVSDFFSQEERESVARVTGDGRSMITTLLWSAKESVLKARREGLRRDTRKIVVRIDTDDTPCRRNPWHRFAAHCVGERQSFHGWWRSSGRFVYTAAVSDEPKSR